MNIAVIPMIEQMLMFGKIDLSGMFKNQYSIRFQQMMPQYAIRYFFNMRHFVRRISKNNVVLRLADRQEMKHVVADDANLLKTEFTGSGADKGSMTLVYFYGMNTATSTRSKLVTDASGT